MCCDTFSRGWNKNGRHTVSTIPSKKLISKKESYGKKSSFKYFIGCNDDDVIRPLCINFSQMIGCVKCFDSNKTISFKVNDNKLLKSILKCCKELAV